MIITRTPYRISLFGGGTDFPEWYSENKGAVLSFTLDKFCYISVRKLPPFFDHSYRVSYSKIETTRSAKEIEHPAVREAILRYFPHHGLEIHHHGDLPARSGVGSSSAFAVGLIHALLKLEKNTKITAELLAHESIALERDILNENVGTQDQIACSYGGLNYIEFSGGQNAWQVNNLYLTRDQKSLLESNLFLVYSGLSRISSDITAGTISENLSRRRILNKLVSIAEQGKNIIDSNSSLESFGELLHESWILKQQLNPLSITTELSEMYENGLKAGALGGKVLGAGGGGFMLFWVPDKKRARFKRFVKSYVHVPFAIEATGTTCILP